MLFVPIVMFPPYHDALRGGGVGCSDNISLQDSFPINHPSEIFQYATKDLLLAQRRCLRGYRELFTSSLTPAVF